MNIADVIPDALRSLTLTRTFDAPRALVWKMWTDPAHVATWWGPEHFTTPVVRMDVRPGGAIHMVMRGPDDADFPFDGRFVAVEEPERLVMLTWVRREDGSTWFEVEQSFRFEEIDGRTRLHLHAVVVEAGADALGPLGGMEAGWSQSFDKLERRVRSVTGG